MIEIKEYVITLMPSGMTYEAGPDSTLLDSALSSGIILEHSCKTGDCGVCKTSYVSSKSNEPNTSSTLLTCQVKPTENLTLYANYFPELADIKISTLPAKVNSVLSHSEEIIVLTCRLPPKKRFKFLPGQYIDLKYQGTTRSYSIASIPNPNNILELHFKRVVSGEMSEKIFSPITLNQLVQIEGPKGTFFFRNKATGPIIFIATGTGFAPIKAIVSQLIESDQLSRPICIYWGNRSSNLFYDKKIIQEWSERFDTITIVFCLSRQESTWLGRVGYVQSCIIEDAIPLEEAEVYACGSIEMIDSAKKVLCDAGLKSDSFHSDAFVAS